MERHLSGSGDSDRDPLDDRGARWAARVEAAGGHKNSRHGSSSHKHKKHHHHSKSVPGSTHGSARHAQVGGSAPASVGGSASVVASPDGSAVGTPVTEKKEAGVVAGVNGL